MALLYSFSQRIDTFNDWVGRTIAWLTLLMVLIQLLIVVMRYVFSVGSIVLQESVWYMHGLVFMLAAGAVYLKDGHVRIDFYYREKSQNYRAWVNLIGIVTLLIPLCLATLWLSKSYVLNSWKTLEGSIELSGLPLIFAYKTVIWIFALLLGFQAISELIKNILIIHRRMGEEEAD